MLMIADMASTTHEIQDLRMGEIDAVNGAMSWTEVVVISFACPPAGAVLACWKIGYDAAHNRADR